MDALNQNISMVTDWINKLRLNPDKVEALLVDYLSIQVRAAQLFIPDGPQE